MSDLDVTVRMSTRAHPASAQQWHLTEEAINQLCDSLPGKPVRINYQGEPVGKVVSAERTEGRTDVTLTIEARDPTLAKILSNEEKFTFGPALFNPDAPPQWPAGEYEMGTDWQAKEVGAVPAAPPSSEE